MSRLKNINAPSRIAFLTVFSVAFLFVFVFPTRSYLSQRTQVNRARHDLTILRSQNKALASEAAKLHTKSEIERIARERYNMASPGEKLFTVVPVAPTTTLPPTTTTTTTIPTTTAAAPTTTVAGPTVAAQPGQ
ncbi:MAG TPA: septum formation initiator family protein [Acidimicrobiia bacterium]|nr:septum formation initiator family protein [Acidimicrobiia bacterium]